MNTFTQRNGITARIVDATLEAPRGLFQDNVIDDATLADDAMRPVLTTQAELRPIGVTTLGPPSTSLQRLGRFPPRHRCRPFRGTQAP
jgi:hypothetical protein